MNTMKFKNVASLLLLSSILLFSFTMKDQVKDWFLAGSNPSEYEIGTINDSERNGNVAYIKSSKSKVKKGFGTIMQSFSSDNYNGKKIKLTGYIKTKDVDEWVGMWMRIDGSSKRALSFDNMQDRPIEGTTNWKKYEIVLDVPAESEGIFYGVLLSGAGEVYLDNLTIEIVGNTAKETGRKKLNAPSNSNFEN